MATIPTLNPNCLKNDEELEKYASELGIDLINLNTDSARAKYITKIKELYNTLNNNKIPELKNCISNSNSSTGMIFLIIIFSFIIILVIIAIGIGIYKAYHIKSARKNAQPYTEKTPKFYTSHDPSKSQGIELIELKNAQPYTLRSESRLSKISSIHDRL